MSVEGRGDVNALAFVLLAVQDTVLDVWRVGKETVTLKDTAIFKGVLLRKKGNI